MRRTIVLDTSSLIHDPSVFKHYSSSDICIPIAVINELDKLKKLPNEAGKNARVAIRMLDNLSDSGDISKGIKIDNDILLTVDATHFEAGLDLLQGLGDPNYGDTQILACALALNERIYEVSLISNDINLRIKAKARGLNAEACKGDKQSLNDLFSGLKILTNEDAGQELAEKNRLDPRIFDLDLEPNECIQLNNELGEMLSAGRKVFSGKVKPIRKIYPWGLTPRNQEQAMLIDLIMDKNIDLITTIGSSGCGKSLVAIACALELVLNKREFEKLIIYRPIQAVGADIGFLPGLLEEKLIPWFQAIMDSFEYLFSNKSANKAGGDWRRDLEMFQKKGRIELSPITYIRGRSIANAIMIVDEAQNITARDMKTILTRAGEGTKIILTGDVDQIDNQFLDATNNGLVSVIERFKSSELAGHITLTKGERSRLATVSAKIL